MRLVLPRKWPTQAALTLGLLRLCTISTLADGEAVPTPPVTAPIQFQVLESQQISRGDHSVTFNRVVPPVPRQPAGALKTVATVESEMAMGEVSIALDQPPERYELLFLSATVYNHGITEVRWFGNQHSFRVFSSFDFSKLVGAGDIETEDTIYTLVLGITHGESSQAPATIPSSDSFSAVRSEYVVVNESDSAPTAEDLAALDALHQYYDANRTTLENHALQRETAQIATENLAIQNAPTPPAPKDTVINFWPKKSRLYPTTSAK